MDLGKFDEALKRNPLFRGLVEEMPGWHAYDGFDVQYEDDIGEVVNYEGMVADYNDDDIPEDDVLKGVSELIFNFGNMDVSGWMKKGQEDVEMGEGA